MLHLLNKKEESQNCPSFAKVQIKNDKKRLLIFDKINIE